MFNMPVKVSLLSFKKMTEKSALCMNSNNNKSIFIQELRMHIRNFKRRCIVLIWNLEIIIGNNASFQKP